MSNIFDEYDNVLREHQAKFGSNTILLFEVGSFYEMYSLGGKDAIFDIHAVCEILNIQVTKRNKNVVEVSRANCLMAGFPSYCLEKFSRTLVENNFTVVIVSQTSPPPKPKREVTSVMSPGVDVSEAKRDWNFVMCIYFFEAKQRQLGAAISYMDVGTGEAFVLDIPPCKDIASQVNRVLLSAGPREVCLIGNIVEAGSDDGFVTRLDLSSAYVHNALGAESLSNVGNIFFQNQLLRKVYAERIGLLQPLEYLDLERSPMLAAAFVSLLAFVSDHSEVLVRKIGKPTIVREDTHLLLSSTSAVQLNLVSPHPTSRSPSLLSMLNRCKTAIGRRAFSRRALSPPICVANIEQQYETQEVLRNNGVWEKMRHVLAGTIDVKRVTHRMEIGMATVADVVALCNTLSKLGSLVVDGVTAATELRNRANEVHGDLTSKFDVETAASGKNIEKANIFRPGVCAELDALHEVARKLQGELDTFGTHLNALAGADVFRADQNDREGAFLVVTIKRYQQFAKMHAETAATLDTRKVSPSSASFKVFHPTMTRQQEQLVCTQDRIRKCTLAAFDRFVATVVEEHRVSMEAIISMIGDIDVWTTNVANAIEFGYTRPRLCDNSSAPFIDAVGLRHPLVERLHIREGYVPNDVQLSGSGMLLYGVNASGKSCFMKSVGLAVIMACSGMYVACSSMRMAPYKSIHTRIPSGDDIARGRSTFTNELIELRNILSAASAHSLVIGDELCSGTETVSAMSIVAAGVVTLANKGSSFVFASHLHDIVSIPEVVKLTEKQKVRICHMGVAYDEGKQKLMYERRLKDGIGSTMYGLEVCRAMDMDPGFLIMANKIRSGITKTPFVPTKKSRYNARLFKDVCALCNNRGDDVHHLIEQHTADASGFIASGIHKNALHNLINICKACHDRAHSTPGNKK